MNRIKLLSASSAAIKFAAAAYSYHQLHGSPFVPTLGINIFMGISIAKDLLNVIATDLGTTDQAVTYVKKQAAQGGSLNPPLS